MSHTIVIDDVTVELADEQILAEGKTPEVEVAPEETQTEETAA